MKRILLTSALTMIAGAFSAEAAEIGRILEDAHAAPAGAPCTSGHSGGGCCGGQIDTYALWADYCSCQDKEWGGLFARFGGKKCCPPVAIRPLFGHKSHASCGCADACAAPACCAKPCCPPLLIRPLFGGHKTHGGSCCCDSHSAGLGSRWLASWRGWTSSQASSGGCAGCVGHDVSYGDAPYEYPATQPAEEYAPMPVPAAPTEDAREEVAPADSSAGNWLFPRLRAALPIGTGIWGG